MVLYCCRCERFVYHPEWDGAPVSACCAAPPVPPGGVLSVERCAGAGPGEAQRRAQAAEELVRSGAVERVVWDAGRPPVRGMKNLGNTCYASAVLQCMVHNPLVRNWALSEEHRGCGAAGEHGCVACELCAVVREVFCAAPPPRPPVVPAGLLYAFFRRCGGRMSSSVDDQQDAHEFAIALLDALHTELAGDAAGAECRCAMHEVFFGTLRSDVVCQTCGHVSATHDRYLGASLSIAAPPDGGVCTLQACLRHYTRTDELAEAEGVRCSACAQARASTKRIRFETLSNVMCFHLKRFEHSRGGRSFSKLDTFVAFPLALDLAPYTHAGRAARPGDGLYELFGVVVHVGRMLGGHYMCYVRSGPHWYQCSDEQVEQVPASAVLASKAFVPLPSCLTPSPLSSCRYLLFYVKKHLVYE